MLKLKQNELTELRLLTCTNRGTKEMESFHDSLFYKIEHHDFVKTPLVAVSIPKRALLLFAGYADKWDENDSLGVKLKVERHSRTKPKGAVAP